jgi:hypothetical protein
MISLAFVALAAAAAAHATQTPLAPAHIAHAPHRAPADTDYARLFRTENQRTPARNTWNGFFTFGSAPPVHCWGADQDEDVGFDVTIVGPSAWRGVGMKRR